ncbi:hypothetical protein DE146DRAFT_10314 [Phaeosphaeria sp. MPI-PUGE-AT-0046c]|nr:hypothetical protein DE146DRAFT_10314 [Phaeosphaeria sp. MPI-PUGE-AT-0046c]
MHQSGSVQERCSLDIVRVRTKSILHPPRLALRTVTLLEPQQHKQSDAWMSLRCTHLCMRLYFFPLDDHKAYVSSSQDFLVPNMPDMFSWTKDRPEEVANGMVGLPPHQLPHSRSSASGDNGVTAHQFYNDLNRIIFRLATSFVGLLCCLFIFCLFSSLLSTCTSVAIDIVQ